MLLKIKSIEVRNVRIPLKDPKSISTKTMTFRDYTIFNIRTEDGVEGWSYVWGLPVVKNLVDMYKNLIIGESAYETNKIWQKLFRQMDRWDRSGIAMRALSGIDIALWDIIGKAANMPIYQLQGAVRESVEVYYSGGYYAASCADKKSLFDYLEKEIRTAYDKGFRAFKMRIGGATPTIDVERVGFVRSLIGPDCKLMVDANCGYDADVILRMARKMEEYDLAWLEEPVSVDDLNGCARVAANTTIPIALGENHFGLWQFREIIEHRAGCIIQADPTVMGGFTEYKKLAGVCAMGHLKMAPHCFHDVSIHMGLAVPEVMIMEYMDLAGDVINVQAIIENPIEAVNGRIRANNRPGHGLILNESAVRKYELL